ncbi:hypothetical protein D3C74_357130 [compost metagenome]
MIGNTNDAKTSGDTSLYIIPDASVGMAAAEMMGMQIKLHEWNISFGHSVCTIAANDAVYSEPINWVSGMPFRSLKNCRMAELTYLPDLVMTPTGCVTSSSIMGTILRVPLRTSAVTDCLEITAAPRSSSTIRFTSSLLVSSMITCGWMPCLASTSSTNLRPTVSGDSRMSGVLPRASMPADLTWASGCLGDTTSSKVS